MRVSKMNTTLFYSTPFYRVLFCSAMGVMSAVSAPLVLDYKALKAHVLKFNQDDQERFSNIKNKDAYRFLQKNIPLFDCPDEDFVRTYFFRWWTYRKHIKKTSDGFVITEFLPKVPWSGKHNTISCPAAYHFYEGRWLHDAKILDDYAIFWLRKGGSPRAYSFWIADACYSRNLVQPKDAFLVDLLPDLIDNYSAWETGWMWGEYRIGKRSNGMFYTIDDRDGSELSIGGSGYRPTINSYMYGDAMAIAKIAKLAGRADLVEDYLAKANRLKKLVQTKLWDPEARFFKVLSAEKNPKTEEKKASQKVGVLANVRELYGYVPWYFNLPDDNAGFDSAWKQLSDPKGFKAPFGPTFAEQRHPKFKLSYKGHECQWNGPSWPIATANVLTGLANLLNNYDQDSIGKREYFETLKTYTKSQVLKLDDGKVIPWIDENQNPYTGEWIARARLHQWAKSDPQLAQKKGGKHRGKDYNHSSYNDLIITGLVGLRPQPDNKLVVHPLIPPGTWSYFCLDNIPYRGFILSIVWDATGSIYGKGRGLSVYSNGKRIAYSEKLERVTAPAL